MRRVLIVDDEPKIRKGINKWIEESAYPFSVAAEAGNGLQALELSRDVKPEILFVDINMPMLNGLDFIQQVKRLVPDSIIVIITGYDCFDYALKAVKLHVFDYLLKPVAKSDFDHMLKNIAQEFNDGKLITEGEVSQHSMVIRHVKEYIAANYANSELSLTDIAELLNLSKSHISKLMKDELGMSFIEYLTEIRISKAKEILETDVSRMTIYQVSARVGYTSQHYFSRVFKKSYGVPPMEYRNTRNTL